MWARVFIGEGEYFYTWILIRLFSKDYLKNFNLPCFNSSRLTYLILDIDTVIVFAIRSLNDSHVENFDQDSLSSGLRVAGCLRR